MINLKLRLKVVEHLIVGHTSSLSQTMQHTVPVNRIPRLIRYVFSWLYVLTQATLVIVNVNTISKNTA